MIARKAKAQSITADKYLLDLLLSKRIITDQQKEQIALTRNQHRHAGKKRNSKADTTTPFPDQVDWVDVIHLLNFELPGSPGDSLDEEYIMKLVATDLGLQFKKLDPLELDLKTVTKTIPKAFALKHLLLPFEIKNGVLSVALYDPANITLLKEIERVNQIKITPFLSTKSDIIKILSEFFGFQSSISAAETTLGSPSGAVDIGNLEQYVKISSPAEIASSDQHIKGAVDHLFNYAFEQHASDIHIEPKRENCQIRIRIDGVLHTIYKLPKVVHPAIVSRIKTLSRIDIAEKRRPQDGRIKIDRNGEEAEIRVSTIPVAFGEKVVLRILDPGVLFQDLAAIGFSERDLTIYQNFIQAPHGIILVTGPTGSGKSTTLYSTLKHIATPEKNVITIEDPVEMVHEEFNQISIQASADITFATILRNILRQDPDIIMIGEIRDLDTARYAIQAALTGHLVFSTLHTNDAVSSITRLIDLGIQPFMIASTLLGALAQRLVRTICANCSESYTIAADELTGFNFPITGHEQLSLKRGKGCHACRGTGFAGRSGVFEIFPMSEALKEQTTAGASEAMLRKIATQEGMTSLTDDAWRKVVAGTTTYQEILRLTGAF